jgi:predicted nucleotidyltransferase
MNKLLKDSLHQIKTACETHSVKTLELFGSMSRNDFNEKSDVDFLYEFDKEKITEMQYADNYFDFFFSLEKILNRKIDLLPKNKLKNPYLIKHINQDRIKIYG